jgi:competence protein ComEA
VARYLELEPESSMGWDGHQGHTQTVEPPPPPEKNKMIKGGLIAGGIGLCLMFAVMQWGAAVHQAPQEVPTTSFALKRNSSAIMVYVAGEVQHPGVVQLEAETRTIDAIKAAGGFTSKANQTGVNLAAKVHDEQMIRVPAIGETLPIETPSPHELRTKRPLDGEEPQFPTTPPARPVDVGREMTPAPTGHFEGGIVEAMNSKSETGISPTPAPVSVPVASNPEVNLTPAPSGSPAETSPPVQVAASSRVSLNRATIEQLESVPGFNPRIAAEIVAYRRGPPPRAFVTIEELGKISSINKSNLDSATPYLKL